MSFRPAPLRAGRLDEKDHSVWILPSSKRSADRRSPWTPEISDCSADELSRRSSNFASTTAL